jgi:hypothetical protein
MLVGRESMRDAVVEWWPIGTLLLAAAVWAGYSLFSIYQVLFRKRRLSWGRGIVIVLFALMLVTMAADDYGVSVPQNIVQFLPLILIVGFAGLIIRGMRRRPADPPGFSDSGAGAMVRATGGTGIFRNPSNAYVEKVSHAGIWCLLFGCFYLAYKGAWMPAVLAFFLALVTAGISWIIFPFFARTLIRKAYLQRGWIEIQ